MNIYELTFSFHIFLFLTQKKQIIFLSAPPRGIKTSNFVKYEFMQYYEGKEGVI